jgi:hypothetical protein
LKYPHPRIVHAHVSARTFAEIPLLFFAAAKKSRCRPAQGQRMKQDKKSRMPAQQKAKSKKQKPE